MTGKTVSTLKLLLAEFLAGHALLASGFLLAQLHPADLARDGLGQFAELDAADALVRGQPLARKRKNRLRHRAARLHALAQRDESLGHRQPHRIGTGHDGRLQHVLVLDQHALQFERADAVVGRLEHVVVAAHVEVVAVGVDGGGVSGVVAAAPHHLGHPGLVAFVGQHQAERPRF